MKVFLDTVGCKLNQSEIEKYASQLHEAGHTIVPRMNEADIVIVNTCAVTSAAAQDSRQKLRKALQINTNMQVIATGCLASLDESLDSVIPGLTNVVPNSKKDALVRDLFGELPDVDYYQRQVIPGSRHRTRAFIKVQDGCDNFCTFCITRIARGTSRSIPVHQVVADIQGAITASAKEVVLTGVQLGSWGKDLDPPMSLAGLLGKVLDACGEGVRVRVSSLEPWDLTPAFFDLWQDSRLCPHFHLPLQSGSDPVLRRMGRKTKTGEYADLLDSIRKVVPDAAITTDVIVGFPGETEQDFQTTIDFVRSCGFAGGHVFSYSARSGTPAAQFSNQINGKIRHQRSNLLREVFDDLGQQYRKGFLGKVEEVLWESAKRVDSGYQMGGWTPHYIRVEALSMAPQRNQIQKVRIDTITNQGCFGEIISPGMPAGH